MPFRASHSPLCRFLGRLTTLLIGCLLWSLAAPCGALFAQQRELKSDASQMLDAVLLLDTSGSMLKNDPGRLRDDGARLFAEFLSSGDRLAIVGFAEDAQIVKPLEPFDPAALDQISKQISSIQTLGQYTDILNGIKAAAGILKQNRRPEAKAMIIMLSDGKMEPPPEKGTSANAILQLFDSVVPDLKAAGIHVYTLAFSEDADKALLSQIAAATDGITWYTPDADKINQSYVELSLSVKKPQVIPLNGKAFNLDPDIQEATFYVNQEEGQEVSVLGPGGVKIKETETPPNAKWYKGHKFDVITIFEPKAGTWQVLGISPQEGFATLMTNLKLVTDWPVSVEADAPQLLQVRLYDGQKPIVLPEMTGAARYAFQIVPTDRVSEPVAKGFLVDDATQGDKIQNDGIFSYSIKLEEQGEYRLRVVAKGPTFERQQQIPFRVKPQVVQVRVVEDEEAAKPEANESAEKAAARKAAAVKREQERKESISSGTVNAVIQVVLSEEARTFKNMQVKLIAVDERKRKGAIPLTRSLSDPLLYEGSAAGLPGAGKYQFQAILTAEGKNRTQRTTASRVANFTLISSEAKAAEEEVQFVAEKPKEPGFWQKRENIEFVIGLLLITAANFGAGFLCMQVLHRSQGNLVTKVMQYEVPRDVLAGMEALEKRKAIAEVDLNDPMFAEETPAAAKQEGVPAEGGTPPAEPPVPPTEAEAAPA